MADDMPGGRAPREAAKKSSGREPAGLRADRGIVLRTPLLPFETLTAWAAAGDLAAQRRFLAELCARPEVREALFVASPGLAEVAERWMRDPGAPAVRSVERSLVKYVARMAGRATPFGLFSGVTPGTLGRETSLELGPLSEYRRRTRIDNDYLFALADALAREPGARARLRYRINSSLYEVAERIRYACAKLSGQHRSYHLVSVEPTSYLRATLARASSGARRDELAEALVRDDDSIELAEAQAYIDELIEAQLLVPELGISITGPEPVDAFVEQLADAELARPRELLLDVRGELLRLDGGLGNPPARYREIAARLAPLPAAPELSRLFQVDMVKPGSPALAVGVAAEVARAIEWLKRTARHAEETTLDEFRRKFSERYEGRTVPLAEVLDEESGIGFEVSRAPGAEGAPLLAGLQFPGGPRLERAAWSGRETHLLRRLAGAIAAGAGEIVLDDADARALAAPSPPPPGPDAMAAMIRLAGTPEAVARGEYQLLLEGASGPSGARLLGRFCHASPEIDAMVRAHLRAEEALRPDAVFAEIVHLNEGRIGNILCRPVLRDHEIVYLGISGAPAERRLPIDDLLVAVRGNRIVLTSRRLGREVVPRLSTAHNYRLRSLGFYRFLCALQQDSSASWSWGPLAGAPFLPRVRLGRVVVARAMWNLVDDDLAPITLAVRAEDDAAIAAAVAALRARARLPRWLAMADGDNELPIDLDNPMLAAAFADELSGRRGASLVELFPAPDALPVRGPEGRFTNEIVLTFVRQRPPAPALPAAGPPAVRRRFTPASPWLYLKLYTGTGTADRILQAAAPAIRDALAAGDATHWFFIRYADPDPHLRLRLAGDPARLHGAALPALERALEPHLASGAIWRMQVDTYERELERYGGDAGIEACERVFWIDSEAVLGILDLLEGDAGADARWRLALRGADQLLEALGVDADDRRALFAAARDDLGREHTADAAFYARLGERWKRERAALEPLLARDPAIDAEHEYAPALAILAERSARLAEVAPALRALPSFGGFAWSLVHMHVNRLLHASQRAQELVLYDFLRRWHEARRARGG
jgi:thiopeptide-type bacteriocin biosynthesis protein